MPPRAVLCCCVLGLLFASRAAEAKGSRATLAPTRAPTSWPTLSPRAKAEHYCRSQGAQIGRVCCAHQHAGKGGHRLLSTLVRRLFASAHHHLGRAMHVQTCAAPSCSNACAKELAGFSGVCHGGLLLSLGLSSHDIRFFQNLGAVCHPAKSVYTASKDHAIATSGPDLMIHGKQAEVGVSAAKCQAFCTAEERCKSCMYMSANGFCALWSQPELGLYTSPASAMYGSTLFLKYTFPGGTPYRSFLATCGSETTGPATPHAKHVELTSATQFKSLPKSDLWIIQCTNNAGMKMLITELVTRFKQQFKVMYEDSASSIFAAEASPRAVDYIAAIPSLAKVAEFAECDTPKTVAGQDTGYTKQSFKHCNGHTTGSSYTSLSAAQIACTSSRACSGVYDVRCDAKPPYFMCKTGVTYQQSKGSCVYTKPNGKGGKGGKGGRG